MTNNKVLIDALKEILHYIDRWEKLYGDYSSMDALRVKAKAALASYAEQAPTDKREIASQYIKEYAEFSKYRDWLGGRTELTMESVRAMNHAEIFETMKGYLQMFSDFDAMLHAVAEGAEQWKSDCVELKEKLEKMIGQVTGKSAGKQQLTDLRNSFYDQMPSSGEIKAWDMIKWAQAMFQEFDVFIDALDESGEAGKQPEQQEINPGFLEGLSKEPLNAIRTLILTQLSEEEKAALLRWLTPEQQPATVSPDSDALASHPNFNQLVSMIKKLFYDYQEDVLKASTDRIDKAWERYKTLNHLFQVAPTQTEVSEEQKGE